MFPHFWVTGHLPAFVRAVYLFWLLCVCACARVLVRMCVRVRLMSVCVALKCQLPYSTSGSTLIQLDARDYITFSRQVTERAWEERWRLTKWAKKKKRNYVWQVGAMAICFPSYIFSVVAAELPIDNRTLDSSKFGMNKHDGLLQYMWHIGDGTSPDKFVHTCIGTHADA